MKILALTLLLLTHQAISQPIDTLDVGEPFQDFNQLEYGAYSFNVYTERDGKRSPEISFASITTERTINGKDVVAINHTWSAMNFAGEFLALVEKETFSPIIQIRKMQGKKEAYRFTPKQIIGLDSAQNNAAADYAIDLPHAVFNFEIDMETFAILPMKEDAVFMVPFFHAGNEVSPPSYYKISVERKEEVEIDGLGRKWCWVLFIDYHGKQPTWFWYTQEGRQFVKMEGEYNGMNIYKVREF